MEIRRRQRLRCILAALGWIALSGLAPATAQLLGPEFQVNSYETGYQQSPAVAADGAGNFVVVWESDCAYCTSGGVFGQRLNAEGGPVGFEFQINSVTTGVQLAPAVAADGAGNFLVVWASNLDGSDLGISGRRFDSAGSAVGSEFQVNSFTTSIQRAPAVAVDGLGRFVVVWTSIDQDGASWGVFGQRIDAAGNLLGSEFQVNSYTTSIQFVPAVTADAAGDFVVVWPGYNQDGPGWSVFGRRFNSGGTPMGSDFQVNSYTTGDQNYPEVAANGAGDFVVVWQSAPQEGPSYGVFGQRFNAAGSPLGSEFHVNSYTTYAQDRCDVAADGAGTFLVTWGGNVQDGSFGGIFGRRYSPAGVAVGDEFQINAFTTGGQQLPAVAADGAGNFVVVWQSPHDGSYTGVFGRQLKVSIFADGFESGDVCAWSAAVGSGDICPP